MQTPKRLARARLVLAGAFVLAPAAFAGPSSQVGAGEHAAKWGNPTAKMDLARNAGFGAVRMSKHWSAGQTAPDATELENLQNAASAAVARGITPAVSIYNAGSRSTPADSTARGQFSQFGLGQPKNNTAPLTLLPPASVALPPVVRLAAAGPFVVSGRTVVRATLRAAPPAWNAMPARIVYRWQSCRATRRVVIAGATRPRSADSARAGPPRPARRHRLVAGNGRAVGVRPLAVRGK